MAYIGVSPSNGVRQKHTYTATASQTTFSGAGAEGAVLSYRDSNYVDVYVNGVKLGDADYTATSGTSIVLGVGAAVNDIVEIMAYDVFSVADTVSKADGGQFDGNVTMAGTLGVTGVLTGTSLDISGDIDIDGTTNLDVVDIDSTLNVQGETTLQTHLNMGDNDIIKLGDSADLQIYHDASNSIIKDTGTGNLQLYAGLRHQFFNADGSSTYAQFVGDGGAGTEYVQLRYANSTKLATTSTGIDVTGGFTATDGCTITTADNTAQLTLISTDADSNFGPLLTMYRNSSSPADADFLGNIEFQGENSAGETITYAQVFGRTGDVTDGTEDGRIATKIMIAGASQNVLDIKSDEIVINDDSVDLDFRVESNNNANMLFVDGGNDRVGIGTSSPNAILHVNGSADNVVNIQVQNTEGTGSRLDMYAFGSSPAIQSAHRAAVYQWTGSGIDLWSRVGDLHFGTNNSERMRITSDGNVGIGTSSPTAKVDLVDDGVQLRLANSTTGTTTSDGTRIQLSGNNLLLINRESANIQLYTADTERMRIDSSGNLLVKKTAHNFQTAGFQVEQSSGETIATRASGTPLNSNRLTNDGEIFGLLSDSVSIGSMSVFAGRLCVGAEDTALKFDAGNDSIMPFNIGTGSNRDNAVDLGYASVRWDDIYATNGTIQTSDQNEKNTITDSDLGIDFIKRLSPKSYIFNGKTRTHYGLIAQDVETVLTDIGKTGTDFAGFIKSDISEEEDGSEYRYGLRYTEFVAPLIKAVKDQQAIIEDLQARITALENA
jgi:cytoskeletal protein CcmA (bactofilin family)